MNWLEVGSVKPTIETLDLNCLLKIFDYLEVESLTSVCDVNEFFKERVLQYNHILSTKWFRMSEYRHFLPTFVEYGHLIRKLEINDYAVQRPCPDKFSYFVQSVTSYLTPGNLTELSLQFGIRVINEDLMKSARPYFCNLTSFAYSAIHSPNTAKQDHMLEEIIGHARNLRNLSICDTRTSCQWLRFDHLMDLEAFTFRFNRLTTTANLQAFIEREPRLKSFVFSSTSVHRQLVSSKRVDCPKIIVYSFILFAC